MSIFEKVRSAIQSVIGFFSTLNDLGAKHSQEIREFVIETADELERWIPDSGFGNVKVMAFDAALKVFLEVMQEDNDLSNEEAAGLWRLAHVLLTGYIAGEKAKHNWDAASSQGGE